MNKFDRSSFNQMNKFGQFNIPNPIHNTKRPFSPSRFINLNGKVFDLTNN